VAGTDGKKGAIAYFVSHPKDEAKTLKELLALDPGWTSKVGPKE
jgi:hypothetical protein